jgi:ATP adenylyltransferase
MERIWAPWRIRYIDQAKEGKEEGCFLCDKPKEDRDTENYILHRGQKNFVILNSYPYNPGHLMVAPYRHVDSPEKLTDEERREHYELVTRSLGVLREVFKPGGFNVGMNLGRVAGAGVDDHIHTHIVPRWGGDTNFMPVMADVRVLPQALAESYEKLRGKF